MNNITNCLDDLNKDTTIWLVGDFNLPNLYWRTEQVVRNQYPMCVNNVLLDKIHDLGLTQTIEMPTRGKNIIDLFLRTD